MMKTRKLARWVTAVSLALAAIIAATSVGCAFPADRYPNQREDARTVGMPYVVFTTTELDADIVYNLTGVIAENRERLVAAHSAFHPGRREPMRRSWECLGRQWV